MSWKYYKRDRSIPELAPYTIIRRPIVSEKATLISQFSHYVFEVDSRATKPEIKTSIERLYKVKVQAINTLPRRGKYKRFRQEKGYRSGSRKAIIILQQGQTIDVGAAVS